MNEIERTIRDLQLYVDVKWGGTNDMLNLALTALKDFCKLQQENEQLQMQVARMREALEYYADIKRWGEVNLIYVPSPDKARKALAEIDKVIGGKDE